MIYLTDAMVSITAYSVGTFRAKIPKTNRNSIKLSATFRRSSKNKNKR